MSVMCIWTLKKSGERSVRTLLKLSNRGRTAGYRDGRAGGGAMPHYPHIELIFFSSEKASRPLNTQPLTELEPLGDHCSVGRFRCSGPRVRAPSEVEWAGRIFRRKKINAMWG
jgi:hypothetical protein